MSGYLPPHRSAVDSGSGHSPLRLPLLLFLALPLLALAQGRFVTAGDKAYENLAYAKAIGDYERAVENGVPDSSYARKLAKSYMSVRDFQRAEAWYARVVAMPNAKPIDHYDYAQALRANGKYGEADKWLRTYELQDTADSRGKRQADASTYASKLSGRAIPGCVVKDLASNTEQADMGVAYCGNKAVFASSRKPDVAEFRRHTWNGQPFLDLYSAPVNADGDFGSATPLSALNTKYHESNACFSPDTGTVWFTRNNYSQGKKGKNGEGVVNLKIYSRTRELGAWTNEQPFPFNSDQYSVGHPCLSVDGNTMYFTSDRPGGKGGTDIWKTVRTGTTWGTPVCLGSEVNTEGDEMFPFIGKDGTFAFASDGHAGLGGLDILVGKMRADGIVMGVKNPGVPLNSGRDDFALVLDGGLLKGYFTSDRPGGKGGDDIYAVELEHSITGGKRVEGVISHWIKEQPIVGSLVELRNRDGIVVAHTITGPGGDFSFELFEEDPYTIQASYADFTSVHVTFNAPGTDTVIVRNLDMGILSLMGAIMDATTGTPIPEVRVEITDVKENLRSVVNDVTDASGEIRKRISDRSLGDTLVYRVSLKKKGYLPKKGLFLFTVQHMTEIDMREVMEKDFFQLQPIAIGVELGEAISVNPIYFDLGKWNIRPDAATELDKVVSVMTENPTMEIELGSHTDSRGSDKANLALSDKRAKSSAAYIITKGIARERIKGKGYGESKLLNECGNDSKCKEEEHQLNRRTEFIITKM